GRHRRRLSCPRSEAVLQYGASPVASRRAAEIQAVKIAWLEGITKRARHTTGCDAGRALPGDGPSSVKLSSGSGRRVRIEFYGRGWDLLMPPLPLPTPLTWHSRGRGFDSLRLHLPFARPDT